MELPAGYTKQFMADKVGEDQERSEHVFDKKEDPSPVNQSDKSVRSFKRKVSMKSEKTKSD